MSSLRSWPAEKAGPLAANTTARTARSCAIAVNASPSPSSIASERLLRVCGWLRVSTATLPKSSRKRISDEAEEATAAAWRAFMGVVPGRFCVRRSGETSNPIVSDAGYGEERHEGDGGGETHGQGA